MVDSQSDGSSPNSNPPTPGGYLLDSLQRSLEVSQPGQEKEVILDSPATPRESLNFHDSGDLTTPTIPSRDLGRTDESDKFAEQSMQGDASEGMPESSRSDHAKAGSPSHRRRSRPPLTNPQRSSGQFHSQSQPNLGLALPSSSSSENAQSRHPTSFQGSPHYPSATVPYNQRGGYVGQYTIPAQPNPMNMPHSPPPPFAFSHTYHPVVPDNTNIMQQNIHPNYPAMLQPHAPVYPFQRHSPEGSATSHPSFSGTRSLPIYPPHQASSSPSSPHLPPSSGQTGGLTSSYVGSAPFHSLQYPPSLSTTPYPYPTQTYPPSPMYQPQYGPSPFGQHYTPTGEVDPQGAWYYVPHNPSTQQYDPGSSYQGHYAVGYPQVGHSGMDSPYAAGPSSNNPPDSTSPYFNIPPHPLSSRYVENRTPSDSPLVTGVGPPELDDPNAPSSPAGSSLPPANKKPVVRRSYHPNPPAHRSEWVMWAGNVPSDSTHDELWRFFNQPNGIDSTTGVLSIFLISRSSCAFINYETEEHLKRAIERFNAVPLRPSDPRCPRLVCRVRRKDDDLKAGVGGQRGMGMHTRWIKEQKGKAREGASDTSDLSTSDDPSASPTSMSERLAHAVSNLSNLSGSSDEDRRKGVYGKHSSSSGSYASTNSSVLARHFPKRYFILKSLTQEDLDISVERSVWATQRHNEEILEQAYRTSKDVYLIFSVNKSGEFYGYARMAGAVQHGERRIPWASRPPQASPKSRLSESSPLRTIFSPSDHRFVDSSPLPVDSISSSPSTPGVAKVRHSAPALLGETYRLPTLSTPSAHLSLDQGRRFPPELRGHSGDDFNLDPTAPMRAMRITSGSEAVTGTGPSSEGQDRRSTRSPLHPVEEEEGDEQAEVDEGVIVEGPEGILRSAEEERTKGEDAWGDSFAVEWICTDRVPFHRTKHLRNPWNRDREIKISRDGTELEPSVGQRLLDEWERLAEPLLPAAAGPSKPTGGKRAIGLKSVPPQVQDDGSEKAAREKSSRSR